MLTAGTGELADAAPRAGSGDCTNPGRAEDAAWGVVAAGAEPNGLAWTAGEFAENVGMPLTTTPAGVGGGIAPGGEAPGIGTAADRGGEDAVRNDSSSVSSPCLRTTREASTSATEMPVDNIFAPLATLSPLPVAISTRNT